MVRHEQRWGGVPLPVISPDVVLTHASDDVADAEDERTRSPL